MGVGVEGKRKQGRKRDRATDQGAARRHDGFPSRQGRHAAGPARCACAVATGGRHASGCDGAREGGGAGPGDGCFWPSPVFTQYKKKEYPVVFFVRRG